MKKILLIVVLLSGMVWAQDSTNYEKSKVIELGNGLTADQIYNQAVYFISSNIDFFYQRPGKKDDIDPTIERLYVPTQPIIYDEPGKKIVCRSTYVYPGTALGLRAMFFEYKITFSFKDERMKVDLSDFEYTHWNFSVNPPRQQQIWGWSDKGDCSSKGDIAQLQRCDKFEKKIDEALGLLHENSNSILSKIEEKIKNSTPKNDDDNW